MKKIFSTIYFTVCGLILTSLFLVSGAHAQVDVVLGPEEATSILESKIWNTCKGKRKDTLGQATFDFQRVAWCKIGEKWYLWERTTSGPGLAEGEGASVLVKYAQKNDAGEAEFANFYVSGYGSAQDCLDAASKKKEKLVFYESVCSADESKPENPEYLSTNDKRVGEIYPATLFGAECAMRIDLGDEKTSENWSLNTIYGTTGISGIIWDCPEKNCGGIGSANLSKDGEWVLDDSVWGKTNKYIITPRVSIEFKSDYYGKQKISTDASPCAVTAFVDCQPRIANARCNDDNNQENCKKLCSPGGEKDFCYYIGRNQCVDAGNIQVTPQDKVNWYSETNYAKPDNYEGFLPNCAFSGTCRHVNDLVNMAVSGANWVFGIMGSVAFMFFIYGGFMMIFSLGVAERVAEGKNIIVYAIIGMVVALTAYMLVNFLLNSLGVSNVFRVIK